MIQEDTISLFTTVGAGMIIIYLATFLGFTNLLLIPLALLALGLTFQVWVQRRKSDESELHDESLSQEELKHIGIYSLVALAGIGLGSFLIREMYQPPNLTSVLSAMPVDLQLFGGFMYTLLYAITEERFFRGGILEILAWKTQSWVLVCLLSGGIFLLYHFAVYGFYPDRLWYVLIAGTSLAFSVVASRRISVSIIGHSINNLASTATLPQTQAIIKILTGLIR